MTWIKIATFLKSLYFHIGAGLPKSSTREIYQRYEICKNCEHFNKIKSECKICGCNISTKKIFLNKLAWADQECPEKKWLKIER